MPHKLFVVPYKSGSKSAKALAQAVNAKRIKREGSNYRPRSNHVLINWGCGLNNIPTCLLGAPASPILNTFVAVSRASNKLECFRALEEAGVSIPPYTNSRDTACDWIEDGDTVVCIAILQGHSGEGITIISEDNNTEVPNNPLYTKYIKKAEEYRIHVFQGTIITRQRKARRTDVPAEEVNWKVRNLAGGFIFARNQEHEIPQCVLDAALASIEALELDFGAVDIIYNAHSEKAYVLEINTACGLEGTTLQEYANAILEAVQ